MGNFGEYSAYYDYLNSDKDYERESDYIHQLIKSNCYNANSLLELGCGTGKHALLLHERGYKITGIDKSAEMLSIAINKGEYQDLKFKQGDVTSYREDTAYDVVISMFHVMSYMTDGESLLKAFKTAAYHLKDGGCFIFDCWNGPAVIKEHPSSRTKCFENESIKVKRTSFPDWKEDINVVNVHFDIEITDKTKGIFLLENEVHEMRYWFNNEIEKYLNLAGFKLINNEGWMTGKELTDSDWNACYIAKKIEVR